MEKIIDVNFPQGKNKITINVPANRNDSVNLLVYNKDIPVHNKCDECQETLFVLNNVKYVSISNTSVSLHKSCPHTKNYTPMIKITYGNKP